MDVDRETIELVRELREEILDAIDEQKQPQCGGYFYPPTELLNRADAWLSAHKKGEEEWHVEVCDKCIQATNHDKHGVCLKCGEHPDTARLRWIAENMKQTYINPECGWGVSGISLYLTCPVSLNNLRATIDKAKRERQGEGGGVR